MAARMIMAGIPLNMFPYGANDSYRYEAQFDAFQVLAFSRTFTGVLSLAAVA